MDNTHHHHQTFMDPLKTVKSAFIIGISLNFLFVLIEVVAGLYVNSLSLLSDAGHNLADVVTLSLSLLAFRLMKVKPTDHYTYGFRKTSILVALFNTMFLLVSIGAIIFEAVQRFFTPSSTSGGTIAIIAAIGIVINGVTAVMFLSNKDKDLNIKSAYLHLMSDALISLGIVAGGILIYFTNWFWIDSVFSIIVALIILFSAWRLLRDSLRLSLDGVPDYINMDDIVTTARKIDGVKSIHHIHIWAISTTENALTAHIVLDPGTDSLKEINIKSELKQALELKNIHHITLETERCSEDCDTLTC